MSPTMRYIVCAAALLQSTQALVKQRRHSNQAFFDAPPTAKVGEVGAKITPPKKPDPIEIAVVGSGPISTSDRQLIREAKEIYRFNSMNNLRKGEPVGTVFVRRGGHGMSPGKVSGIPPSPAVCPLIWHAKGLVVLVDSGPTFPPYTLKNLKEDFDSVELAYGLTDNPVLGLSPNKAGFSSGFAGVAWVLQHSELVKKGAKVNIFGMNWKATSVHSGGHPWAQEAGRLRSSPQVIIHPAASQTYKPTNASGKMNWICEGGYTFKNGQRKGPPRAGKSMDWVFSFGNTTSMATPNTYGVESNDDGSFVATVVNGKSTMGYIAADGSLVQDKSKAATVLLDDAGEEVKFKFKVGEDQYELAYDMESMDSQTPTNLA